VGRSTPLMTCESTDPMATSDASVSRIQGTPGIGNDSVIELSKACFSLLNAVSASGDNEMVCSSSLIATKVQLWLESFERNDGSMK